MVSIPTISRGARITIALAIADIAIGCDDGAMPCEGTCIADPAPHCLRGGPPPEVECLHGRSPEIDCPGGLVADEAAVGGTVCAGPVEATHCRWRPPPITKFDELEAALIDGFATKRMEMHIAPPPGMAFAWTPPSGAAFVACGIFTCPPVFDCRDPIEPAASLNALYQIRNAGACLMTLQVTTAVPSSLPIGARPPPVDKNECSAERDHDRVIDFVAAGCWAYDSTEIVGASPLVPLRASDLAGVVPGIPTQASCLRDGDACYDDAHAHPFFGTCLGGTCQPRCASPADCETAGIQLIGRAPDAACSWECRALPDSLVGVCAPLAG